ncbi:hypothetical protein [Bradyrhizobium genosp. A]|uniref:hypothetical protein n=1 Tax=Bradyrhizobium genosp. A TaxID=83626 RepID=UPI003CEC35D3
MYRRDAIGRCREGVADAVVAQREGGDRSELRSAAVIEGVRIDSEQIQSSGLIRQGSSRDRGGIAVVMSSISPVAILPTVMAAPITSPKHFSPFGPLRICSAL